MVILSAILVTVRKVPVNLFLYTASLRLNELKCKYVPQCVRVTHYSTGTRAHKVRQDNINPTHFLTGCANEPGFETQDEDTVE